MRPDCSVRVRPRTRLPEVRQGSLDVWLHFDAKYRVERAREQFDAGAPRTGVSCCGGRGDRATSRSKREDLLKMHAYRDAIRGSAGRYVLFPGDDGRRAVSRVRRAAARSRGLCAASHGGSEPRPRSARGFLREALSTTWLTAPRRTSVTDTGGRSFAADQSSERRRGRCPPPDATARRAGVCGAQLMSP